MYNTMHNFEFDIHKKRSLNDAIFYDVFRYGFGWEPQLAELTFHAMFMAPLLSLNAIPYKSPVPTVTIWVSDVQTSTRISITQ